MSEYIKSRFFITASNENDDKLSNDDDNLVTINLHMNGRIYEVSVYFIYL